ncbi:uncharacterized protein LOC125955327 [Anopheles darlingi]|uniref:uncharacterized protein LOC125955327 n=1 Tax=Anopheles darlingi TaxID=43151 RepID=UPI0021006112|nr:uncharacterized protein LOC125955327 [Anopheles darlingi]
MAERRATSARNVRPRAQLRLHLLLLLLLGLTIGGITATSTEDTEPTVASLVGGPPGSVGRGSGKTCKFPGAPAHGSVEFTDDALGDGTVATYYCERGFELLGPSRRVCNDGQWIPEGIPFCVLNVAAGKAPMQISTEGSGIPQKAIDGSTSAFFSADSCSLTKLERVPWWYVNLLEPYMVQLVRLDFGKSCCGNGTPATIVVRVGNNRPDLGTNPICNRFTGTLEEGQPLFLPCNPPMPGAFVSVHLETAAPSQLSICEAFVYTDQALPIERCPAFRDQPPGASASYNGKCYIFYNRQPVTLRDALAFCRARGGTLINESNPALQGFISWELWRRHRSDTSSQYWMGAVRDAQDRNTWKWIGGEEVSVSFWNLPGGEEDCARYDGSKGWLWSDTNCNTQLNFICQHQPKACGRPEQPPNSTMLAPKGFDVGAVVEYSCDEGHLLVGPQQRTCLETGFYNEFPPVCRYIECGLPASIPHGYYDLLNGTVGYLSTVQYRCADGYEMVGRAVLTCDIDERWNGPPPRCELIECDPLPTLFANGVVFAPNQTVYGAVAEVRCNRDYVPDGVPAIRCTATGQWNHTLPACIPRAAYGDAAVDDSDDDGFYDPTVVTVRPVGPPNSSIRPHQTPTPSRPGRPQPNGGQRRPGTVRYTPPTAVPPAASGSSSSSSNSNGPMTAAATTTSTTTTTTTSSPASTVAYVVPVSSTAGSASSSSSSSSTTESSIFSIEIDDGTDDDLSAVDHSKYPLYYGQRHPSDTFHYKYHQHDDINEVRPGGVGGAVVLREDGPSVRPHGGHYRPSVVPPPSVVVLPNGSAGAVSVAPAKPPSAKPPQQPSPPARPVSGRPQAPPLTRRPPTNPVTAAPAPTTVRGRVHEQDILLSQHPQDNEIAGSVNIRQDQSPKVNVPFAVDNVNTGPVDGPVDGGSGGQRGAGGGAIDIGGTASGGTNLAGATAGDRKESKNAKLNLGAIVALGAFGGFVFLAAVITTIVIVVRRNRTTNQHYRHRASPDCNTVASFSSSSSESRNGLNRYYRQAWENLHESASKSHHSGHSGLKRKETMDAPVNRSRSRENLDVSRSRENLSAARSRDYGRDSMAMRDGSEMVVSDVCVKGEKKRHHHHHHKSSHQQRGDFREPNIMGSGNGRREHCHY